MTTEELIPVLKALHADPRCSPMMADWFEERGDERLAVWLRANGALCPMGFLRYNSATDSGSILISAMMNLPSASRSAIRKAVTADACQRHFEKWRHPLLDQPGPYLEMERAKRDLHQMVMMRTGRRPAEWHVMNMANYSQEDARESFIIYIQPTRTEVERRRMTGFSFMEQSPHVLEARYDPWTVGTLTYRMDGEPLRFTVDFWWGTDSRGLVHVSEIEPRHVRAE